MKRIPAPFLVTGVIIILFFFGFLVWGIPYFFRQVKIQTGASTFGSQTVLARVTKIVEEGHITLSAKPQFYQIMQVEVLEGEYKGIPFQVDYGKTTLRSDNFRFAVMTWDIKVTNEASYLEPEYEALSVPASKAQSRVCKHLLI
jgi:hypothetical protein